MAFKSNCGLWFREVEPSDLPMLRELRNTQAVGWRDNRGVQTLYQQEKWYLSLSKENMAFVVEDKNVTFTPIPDKQPVAMVGLLRISNFDWLHKNVALTGTDVFAEFQGQRYGTRILKAGAEYCIHDLGFHRVTAQCLWQNDAARRAILAAGFTYEGVWRRAIWRENEWHDFQQFSILAEEVVK